MGYTQNDMRKVRAAISAALPNARFTEWDYGFAMAVYTDTAAITLFETVYPELDEDGSLVEGGAAPIEISRATLSDVPMIVKALSPRLGRS